MQEEGVDTIFGYPGGMVTDVMDELYKQEDIRLVLDQPCRYNRIVPEYYFNREKEEVYALGPFDGREAVLLFNRDTKLTPEKSIEYFI